MQSEPQSSRQLALDGAPRSHNHALGVQLLCQDDRKNAQEGYDWLNEEFSRLPYHLYKFWLALTFLIVLSVQCFVLISIWNAYKEFPSSQFEDYTIQLAMLDLCHILLGYGCLEMLFGMR